MIGAAEMAGKALEGVVVIVAVDVPRVGVRLFEARDDDKSVAIV